MKIRHFMLAAALILGTATDALAKDNGLGSWGFVPVPPPPGTAMPVTPPAIVPLAPWPDMQAPLAPLVENPGNVPIEILGSDPSNITIRQLVRVSAAGNRIRLRFSNESGSDVLSLGAVHVGMAGPDGSVVAGRAVTFDRRDAIIIPAGAPLLSDPIDLPVKALDRLVISIHVPGAVSRTGHTLLHYVAGVPGNHTAAAQLPSQKLVRLTALVTQVDVDATTAHSVVVCLGDSITDGATSTINAFRSYPDRLAERLAPAGKWAVVNAGIGGNKLLRYGTGPNALARLDRDVFGVPGVKAIILLEGINDIGRGFQTTGVQDPVTAEALIAAYRQIIQRAHDQGIRVIGATLTPYQGAGYASPAGEEVRQALNKFILSSGEFDGVVDFAAATADKANPLAFAAE